MFISDKNLILVVVGGFSRLKNPTVHSEGLRKLFLPSETGDEHTAAELCKPYTHCNVHLALSAFYF